MSASPDLCLKTVTFIFEPSCLQVLCWIICCPTCYEAQQSVWSARLWRGKKQHNFTLMWQLRCAIYTTDPSSVHTQSPPELVSLLSFFVVAADCSKRLWNFGTETFSPPFQNFDSHQAANPLKLLGKLCKEEEAAVELCIYRKLNWRLKTQQCTLPLCVPQPHPTQTESTVGLDGSGYLAQYQIRGVPPNAVDLRVFLAFGTVQTRRD